MIPTMRPAGHITPLAMYGQSAFVLTSCARLKAKMWPIMKMLGSHTGWDRSMPAPRGGGRHAAEIADFWRAYGNCQSLYSSKPCKDDLTPPSVWENVMMKVPGSDAAWNAAADTAAIVGTGAAVGAAIVGTGGAAAPVLAPIFAK